MFLVWFMAFMCAARGAPFPAQDLSSLCPSNCECLTVDLVTTTRCSSLAFINDASSEILNKVSHLDIRHSNLTKLTSIRKLHGLKTVNMAHNDLRHLVDISSLTKLSILNLRGNKLKTLDLNDLPKNLEHLDVSANHLGVFPDFHNKKLRLREVNLEGNPFTCSCELKTKCDSVQKSGVIMVKPVSCRDGSGNIKQVSNLMCPGQDNDLEKMQNDQEMEGSGDEPGEEASPEPQRSEENDDQTDVFADSDTKLEGMQNEGLLPTQSSTVSPDLTDEDYLDNGDDQGGDEDEEEGSGHMEEDVNENNEDEGSGSEILIIPSTETPLKACNFDCSTPLTLDDPESTNSTEPDPSILDEVGKVFKDIFSSGEDDEELEPSSNETTEAPMVSVVARKPESGRKADNDRDSDSIPVVINEEDKLHSAEGSEASEVKEAGNPFGLSNNMIVVIALIIVMACIILYTILTKRRKNRRHPRGGYNGSGPGSGQEMKTIKPVKPVRTSIPDNNKSKGSDLPEKVPLMNGQKGPQNGNQNGNNRNGNGPDVTTPLINEPLLEKEDHPVEMRQPPTPAPRSPRNDSSPLLPETHKVTVQAKELTAPKTPLLVNRVKSYDGQIITTPETDSGIGQGQTHRY